MTDDIIRMAREAGFCTGTKDWFKGDGTIGSRPFISPHGTECGTELERLIELVRADEREACAKVANDHGTSSGQRIAEAIRARGTP